jgi:hypothetical protein
MSFKVKDLSVRLAGPGYDDLSTCTTMTKPCEGSIFWRDGRPSCQHDLAALKTQLRRAMTRA